MFALLEKGWCWILPDGCKILNLQYLEISLAALEYDDIGLIDHRVFKARLAKERRTSVC